jgi:hypothetical protein
MLWRSGSVPFVADLFHPVDGFAVEGFLDRDMSHRRGRRRAVPVPFARRKPDDVTHRSDGNLEALEKLFIWAGPGK